MPRITAQRVSDAFLSGQPYRSKAAMFCTGNTVYSYGDHYVVAYRLADGVIRVNEAKVSATTSQHVGAIRRAIEAAGYRATNCTVTGPNSHRYREFVRS